MAASIANSLIRVSSGLQYEDLLATKGNPNTDQFVKVLQKTTRWAAQWRRVDFDGQFGFGKRVSLTVPRIAELINGVMLVVEMPDIATAQQAAQTAAGANFLGPYYGWTNALGHALIQTVELEIGGAIVETMDGRLLEVLDELYEPLDTLKAKNRMIARAANGFGPTTWVGTPTNPIRVHVPIPFWFSRPGRYSHALPIDAIYADKVRIHVTFRPVEDVYYTDARYDERTVGFRTGVDVSGAMPELQGGRFWRSSTAPTAGRVYSMNASMTRAGVSGEVMEGYTMPSRLEMEDAYFMLEYVSVEEPEAIALRSAELTYFVEQHNAIQAEASQNTTEVRIELPLNNPTKEILWVLQRPEAADYNAWFLFTRDLAPYTFQRPNNLTWVNPCTVPWWPDAELTPLAANDWRVLPAFRTADSEPITGAAVYYNSYERFEIKGPALFRALLPTQKATKAAVHDRYVYMWPFGYGAEREDVYRPAGVANWDKIPRKEMYISMADGPACTQHPNMNVYVWTTNWNILKVFGGRAGLLFSN